MAVIKDYYRILNVRSSATTADIKNAYRKLAMKYHPDRNPDDALAAAVFTDVAEAYGILSDEAARKQYNNDRYFTAEKEYKRPLETIEHLTQRIQKINGQLKHINQFHFNKDALLYSIIQLFPEEIDLLLYTNNLLLKQFLDQVLLAVKLLDAHQTKQLLLLLQPLYKNNEWLQHSLNNVLQQQQKNERWEKYKIILAVVIAVILCVIIFYAAGK